MVNYNAILLSDPYWMRMIEPHAPDLLDKGYGGYDIGLHITCLWFLPSGGQSGVKGTSDRRTPEGLSLLRLASIFKAEEVGVWCSLWTCSGKWVLLSSYGDE